MKTAQDIYADAAKLIERRDAFTRYNTAQRPSEKPDEPPLGCLGDDHRATYFNAGGAIIHAAGSWPKARSAWLAFRQRVCPDGQSLYAWSLNNDHRDRLAALRKAAESCE